MCASFRPGYEIAWGVMSLLRAFGSVIPLPISRSLGSMLGRSARHFARRDVLRARNQLKTAFPDISREEEQAIIKGMMRHLGITAAEVLWLLHANSSQVDGLCELRGKEHLSRALDQGHGAVLITGHIGNWELLNARLGTAGFPMTIAVRDLDDPRFDRLATTLRERFGPKIVQRGKRAGQSLLKALQQNGVTGLLIDQDIRDIPGVHVPFFGRPALTPVGAAQLALAAGCPVIPVFSHRREDMTHLAEILPVLPIPDSGSMEERALELTARATTAIEAEVRRHPDQWVWMHRRWRTKPGDPRIIRRKMNDPGKRPSG